MTAAGVTVDVVADRHVAEGIVEVFAAGVHAGVRAGVQPGARILLPQAAAARDVVATELGAMGWTVDVVEAYRTVPVDVDDRSRQAIAGADAVTLTSSSTVEQFVAAVGIDLAPPVVACIGPVTAATAQRLGLPGIAVADPHSLDGLVDVVVRALGPPDGSPQSGSS
jgi:uroporphyrinogen-III synthase